VREFRKLLSELKNSKPIFKAQRSSWSSDIEFDHEGKVHHEFTDSDCWGLELAKTCFTERFNDGSCKFETDYDTTEQAAKREMMAWFTSFIIECSGTKHPKNTKLYKFLGDVRISDEPTWEALYSTYKYLRGHNVLDKDSIKENAIHIKNGLGVLEIIRARSEKEGT